MTLTDDLPTPCVLVEQDRLTHNLETMQARADAQGVHLRPHAKTHRSTAVARRQRELGAAGLTVAKVQEAQVFVDAGFDDVRIAYTVVGEDALLRLARLGRRARVSFCVDTPEGARRASHVFSAEGETVDVLVEVDVGYGRCGVRWDDPEAVALLGLVAGLPGLRLTGLLTHAGHAYGGPGTDEDAGEALRRVMREERDRVLALAVTARAAGVPGVVPGAFDLSVGSTPSMRYFENAEQGGFRITEIRPGNYVFHDAIQQALGAATWHECALTVLATVVSRHRNSDGTERVFLDAGKKVFTSDRVPSTGDHGVLLYNPRVMEPLPHARLHALSEEHGWVRVPGGATLAVGDRVRVVPAHACVVVSTQDTLHVVEGDQVVDTFRVDARGCST